MTQEPVFEQAGRLLLEHLRGEMIPAVLNLDDDIKMAHPGEETDYRFGVFLYDIEYIRPYGPPSTVRLNENTWRHPDCFLALHFLLYANRRVPFDSLSALDEMVLLEAAVRAVHSMDCLAVNAQKIRVEPYELSGSEKIALWQSLNSPLQPSVCLTLQPVQVPSTRLRRITPVREIHLTAKRKEPYP